MKQTKSKMVFHQTILEAQVEIQQKAFERVGAELYENIGQMLFVAQLHLHSLEDSNLNTEQLMYIHQTSDIISRTIGDIRALIRDLESLLVKDFDLIRNLRLEFQKFRNINHQNLELNIKGVPQKLGYEKEILLFSVILKLVKSDSYTMVMLDYQKQLFSVQIQRENALEIALKEWEIFSQNISIIGGKCSLNHSRTQINIDLVEM